MPRKIRLGVISYKHTFKSTVEENRARALEVLGEACAGGSDIVCLPEGFNTVGVKGAIQDLAEPVPGPTTDCLAQAARDYGTYLVCTLYRKAEGRLFNSAVLLDRRGGIAGIYDKMHHANTSWGAFKNNRPYQFEALTGERAPVFQLDFGKVGVQICFDLEFDEGWQQLADGGAELVFWPSAYDGGLHLQARAFRHHFYLASAVQSEHAAIINPLGEVLGRSGSFREVLRETIDLDYLVCHFDWHRKRLAELASRFGRDVTVRVAQEEGYFLVQSEKADLPLSRVLQEVPLLDWRTFLERHRQPWLAARQAAR